MNIRQVKKSLRSYFIKIPKSVLFSGIIIPLKKGMGAKAQITHSSIIFFHIPVFIQLSYFVRSLTDLFHYRRIAYQISIVKTNMKVKIAITMYN